MGKMRQRKAREAVGSNDATVLRVLRSATSPMTAYQILAAARSEQIAAATTVYRSLARLTKNGVAHRLESMNAYVACSDCGHHHGPVVFAICRDCGRVDELSDRDAVERLTVDAHRLGFTVDTAMIELSGRCASCIGGTQPDVSRPGT